MHSNGGRPTHRGAETVEAMYQIAIGPLRKRGMLTPGRNAVYRRHPDDDQRGMIAFAAREGHGMILQFNERGEITEKQRIDYRRRELKFGPVLYFACPSCRRAVGIVYVHPQGRIGCRLCFDANYISTRERPYERAARRARAIRARLGVLDRDDETFPARPKGLHWCTYHRLAAEHAAFMDRYEQGLQAVSA